MIDLSISKIEFVRKYRSLSRFAMGLSPRVIGFHGRYEILSWLGRKVNSKPTLVTPTAIYVETSSFCRGRCRGCYVPVADRKAHYRLDDQTLGRIVAAARVLRPEYVCIVGGEPLDPSIVETNLALVRSAPELRFLLCTGAQGYDTSLMWELSELSNLSMMFSVDGGRATHDSIRGVGNYARVIDCIENYTESCAKICGASVTLRRENWREVSSEAFVRSLEDVGCNIFSYDPWFDDEGGEGISSEILAEVIRRLRAIVAESRSVIYVNPFGPVREGGLDRKGGMVAAAIDYRGNVYGSRRGKPLGNVTTQGLRSILEGEAFQQGYRRLGIGGCAADDPRLPLFEEAFARLSVFDY